MDQSDTELKEEARKVTQGIPCFVGAERSAPLITRSQETARFEGWGWLAFQRAKSPVGTDSMVLGEQGWDLGSTLRSARGRK